MQHKSRYIRLNTSGSNLSLVPQTSQTISEYPNAQI